MVKVCTKCKIKKELTEFSKDKKTKDNHRSDCNSCRREYYIFNRERILQRQCELRKLNNPYLKIKNNPYLKMKKIIRDRTNKAFKRKGYSKNTKTQEILGIEWEVAKQHIERQFTKGMNWDNQGKWHIDHIIPLASANTEEELIKLCHYTNIQPLWAEDNLTKSDKIDSQQILLRI